jgi:hypothetical protein
MKKNIWIICLVAVLALSLFSCQYNETENDYMNSVKMTAKIVSIGEKIEVEVVEEENGMTGIFWVNVNSDTVILDKNGNRLFTLQIGQLVEITYDGKVMMSYPPQIAAQKIQLK